MSQAKKASPRALSRRLQGHTLALAKVAEGLSRTLDDLAALAEAHCAKPAAPKRKR